MRFYLTPIFLLVTFVTFSQFSDDFSDGDFTTAPTWLGMEANFEVNAENQLHLVAPAEEDTSYLSTASSIIDDVTWDFWVRMDFNPSSGNNARVYLMADNSNLKESLNGYFVLIGNTTDEISLYRQDGLSITKIIDGADDAVDVADVTARVRVTRDAAGNWELLSDPTGGFAFASEGTTLDNTHTTASHVGVFCKYTSSRSELFYFDDLGVPYADGTAPELVSVTPISATALDVQFSEPVDAITGQTTANYTVNEGIGNPVTAILDGVDPALVHLTFATAFINGTTYEIDVALVEDLDGNTIEAPATETFLYFVPEVAANNDVIFTEVLADPNPVIGLPEVEFFEIYNRSAKTFNLAGWIVKDNTTTATLNSYVLAPNAYVVICSPGDGSLVGIANFLETDGLPTLTNSEDDLVLKDDTGLEIDSIRYKVSWYKDTDKDDGGWTLERKHLNSPCSDFNNWGASVNPSGGTPGVQNSIWTDEDDVTAPTVSNLQIINETTVELSFSESMDTTVGLIVTTVPGLDALSSIFTALDKAILTTETLQPSVIYELTVGGGADCWGNTINQTVKFGLPGIIEPEDIILNEILFNPLTGGSDYVEIYNKSNKILDAHQLYLANYDDEDGISNFEQVGTAQQLMLPGEYLVLTEDSTDIIDAFSIYAEGTFLETDLPTYPNDSGTVYLTLADSSFVDYFHYDEDFHFALLSTEDGKALERITSGGGMNNPENWHTASENVDWGTPGYQNSQFLMPTSLGEVSVSPQLFSPDNDGYNDVVTINFDLIDTDNITDVIVYDNQGRTIRMLQDNYFIGQRGFVKWDGINDNGEKAAIGTYVILVSVKNAAGNESLFKLVTVLGGQL